MADNLEQAKQRIRDQYKYLNPGDKQTLEKVLGTVDDETTLKILKSPYYEKREIKERIDDALISGSDRGLLAKIFELDKVIKEKNRVVSEYSEAYCPGGGDGHSSDDATEYRKIPVYGYTYSRKERKKAKRELKELSSNPDKYIGKLALTILNEPEERNPNRVSRSDTCMGLGCGCLLPALIIGALIIPPIVSCASSIVNHYLTK